jgi:regulator of replication initiation timing
LDNEIILDQIEEIEKRVEKVIEVCKTLEAANSKLQQRVKELEGELQGKAEAETRYTRERELIRSKVDLLLSRLDEISPG